MECTQNTKINWEVVNTVERPFYVAEYCKNDLLCTHKQLTNPQVKSLIVPLVYTSNFVNCSTIVTYAQRVA